MEKNQHLSLNNKENKQEKKHKRYIQQSAFSPSSFRKELGRRAVARKMKFLAFYKSFRVRGRQAEVLFSKFQI